MDCLKRTFSIVSNPYKSFRKSGKPLSLVPAKGNYKLGSDIDIAIWGEEVTFNTGARLHSQLEEESPMSYFFDMVDYTHLKHDQLRDHIDRVGKETLTREQETDI